LDRQVQMATDLGERAHSGNHPVGHVPWMRAREADAFDALYLVYQFK